MTSEELKKLIHWCPVKTRRNNHKLLKYSDCHLNISCTRFELTNFAVVIKEAGYMNLGKIVVAQIMQFMARREFNDIVAKYSGNYRVRSLTSFD